MAEHDPQEIAWEAPEFEYRHKDISWYWISIIVAVVCIGFAAWQKNFLFGFFVLVAEILILAWANQQPAIFNFRLTEKGLFIQNKNQTIISSDNKTTLQFQRRVTSFTHL